MDGPDRFESERKSFPITERFAYLDHASRGPLSPAGLDVFDGLRRELLMVHPDQQPRMVQAFREAREAAADLIGAPRAAVAFIPNTSTGIALAAGSLPLRSGDNVICGRGEFPANIYPWLNLGRKGVEVRFLEQRPGGFTADQVREAMDVRTRAVALSWVGFCDGARIDTGAIAGVCAEQGAYFIVDAIQGVGALQVDLTGIDILVCGSGKWTLAPQGGGVAYIRPERIEAFEPDRVGWLSVASTADSANYTSLTDYRFELAPDARRAETGSNALLGQLMLGASCRYLHGLGIRGIEERILSLCDYLIEGLERKGYAPLRSAKGGLRSGIVCFSVPDAPAAARSLAEKGVIVSAREGRIRAGIHFYNNEADLDRLLEGLD